MADEDAAYWASNTIIPVLWVTQIPCEVASSAPLASFGSARHAGLFRVRAHWKFRVCPVVFPTESALVAKHAIHGSGQLRATNSENVGPPWRGPGCACGRMGMRRHGRFTGGIESGNPGMDMGGKPIRATLLLQAYDLELSADGFLLVQLRPVG